MTMRRWLILLWTATLAAGGAAMLFGTTPGRPVPRPGSLDEVLGILLTNLRVALALSLLQFSAFLVPRMRYIVTATIATVLALNALLVGATAGAMGPVSIRWLPHLPLEWAALAASASGKPALCAASGPLILVAALVESFATPQAPSFTDPPYR